ncbi:1-phosphofructokinase family hexose kinase [Deinococcus aquaticus]|uniref:1-phosphofructokinase family hexose kinase n=1 Tax=Deinococcus aquaticus TaxID=328692 RepID=UPI003F46119E
MSTPQGRQGGARHVTALTMNPALDLTVRADGWQRGEVNAGQSLQQDAGGKGVNVASILADWSRADWSRSAPDRAGQEGALSVTATGLLGRDNAAPFEALFREKGVTDAFVRVSGATRVGVKLVDGAAQETTDINLPGLSATPETLAELHAALSDLSARSDAVVLAGSLPPGVPADYYATLTAQLRAAGVFVALDTSGAALNAALAAPVLPDLIKPNIHELEGALGRRLNGDAEVLQAARDLIARGAQIVAVSQGERGALIVTATGAVFARPPRVQVLSTVGAGDAMVAGLVSAHISGLSLEDAARRATSFSAGSITRLGPHLPDPAALAALAAQVEVTPA